MTDTPRILFFSRAREQGHPDFEIADGLKKSTPGMELVFAGFGVAGRNLKDNYPQVEEIDLPDNPSYLSVLFKAHSLIGRMKPHLVIAHDECAALSAAHLLGLPSLYISTWLPAAGSILAESLNWAGAIVVLENAGIFSAPPGILMRPYFVGPVPRRMKFGRDNRDSVRRELGLSEKTVVIVVAPERWTEERAPIADPVLSAFHRLKAPEKKLFWLAGQDVDVLRQRTSGIRDVEIIGDTDHPPERYLVAADVLITKATRSITVDAAALGVPTISLSHGLSLLDDAVVPRFPSNVPLNAKAADGQILAFHIGELLSRAPIQPSVSVEESTQKAVNAIVTQSLRLLSAVSKVGQHAV